MHPTGSLFLHKLTFFLVFSQYIDSQKVKQTNKQINKKKKSKQKKSAKHCILMSDENPQIEAIKAKKKVFKMKSSL